MTDFELKEKLRRQGYEVEEFGERYFLRWFGGFASGAARLPKLYTRQQVERFAQTGKLD